MQPPPSNSFQVLNVYKTELQAEYNDKYCFQPIKISYYQGQSDILLMNFKFIYLLTVYDIIIMIDMNRRVYPLTLIQTHTPTDQFLSLTKKQANMHLRYTEEYIYNIAYSSISHNHDVKYTIITIMNDSFINKGIDDDRIYYKLFRRPNTYEKAFNPFCNGVFFFGIRRYQKTKN